jgi:ABC-2 type transport system ATP-binding protein
MEQLLEATHLRRRFGDLTAVYDVSVRVARREVLGFLGPNGAGKSTCLRMITGALAPDAGAVRVLGIDLWRDPVPAKARIGYLPEHPPLYPDQRVDEYLDYCARLRRVASREVAATVGRVKRRCGIEGIGRRLIRHLSKGFRQRVGIAQAIVHDPALIVLDEPTVGLDPVQVREIRALIQELAADHGVLISTHLLPEAQSLCHRVLILRQGRVAHESVLRPERGAPVATRLYVALERPPALARLQALPGVTGVEQVRPDAFRLATAPATTAAEVARRVVEAGWGLLELTPQREDLEQVFVSLLAGEQGP